jgi:ubiquinone/menaquinone biosynthesis C-methylase UbiE
MTALREMAKVLKPGGSLAGRRYYGAKGGPGKRQT